MLAPLTSIVLDGNRLVYICLCVFEKFVVNYLIAKIEFYLIATKYKWVLIEEKGKIKFFIIGLAKVFLTLCLRILGCRGIRAFVVRA